MTVLSGSISPQMGGAIRVPIDNCSDVFNDVLKYLRYLACLVQ